MSANERGLLGGAERFAHLRDFRGDGGARFVEQFADDRLLFLAQRLHLLAPRGDAAAAAEILDAQRFQRGIVGARRGLRSRAESRSSSSG